MIEFKIPGSISVLGTPAEEGGGGKIPLLAAGAYEGVDACLMCHPGPGPDLDEENWGSVRPSLAIQVSDLDASNFCAVSSADSLFPDRLSSRPSTPTTKGRPLTLLRVHGSESAL